MDQSDEVEWSGASESDQSWMEKPRKSRSRRAATLKKSKRSKKKKRRSKYDEYGSFSFIDGILCFAFASV